jgi:hypothetical protein
VATSYNAYLKETSKLLKRNSIIDGLISIEITCPKELQCMTANAKYYIHSPKRERHVINRYVACHALITEFLATLLLHSETLLALGGCKTIKRHSTGQVILGAVSEVVTKKIQLKAANG